MPLPRQSAEQIQQILRDIYDTGHYFYLDKNNTIQVIPDEQSKLLKQSQPSILPYRGVGHQIPIFDKPFINDLLQKQQLSRPSPI